MNKLHITLSILIAGFGLTAGSALSSALADAGHSHGPAEQKENVERMKDLHRGHEHGHDFEAMEEVSAEDTQRLLGLMAEIGLALPPLDSQRGRELFVNTGCVVCHSVNNVGGDIGPSLNADDMPQPMNAFDFSARMWRGAPAMAQMQEDLLGEVIGLSGQDLADLVAFAHDKDEQKLLKDDQIPARLRNLIHE
jgi:mono/diheme cytochrome c family protein